MPTLFLTTKGDSGRVVSLKKEHVIAWLIAFVTAFIYEAYCTSFEGYRFMSPSLALAKGMLLFYGVRAYPWVVFSSLVGLGFWRSWSNQIELQHLMAWYVDVGFGYLMLRLSNLNLHFRRIRDLFKMTVFGGFIPAVCSSFVAGIVFYQDGGPYLNVHVQWVWGFASLISSMSVLPLLIIWLAEPLGCIDENRWQDQRTHPFLELSLLGVVSVLCVTLAFGRHLPDIFINSISLHYICFLPLTWASIRFGSGITSLLLVGMVALGGGLEWRCQTVTFSMYELDHALFLIALSGGALVMTMAMDGERSSRKRAAQAEQETRQSRHRLWQHIERAPVAVIEWDVDFRVVEWNPAAEKIFGYSRDEAIGMSGLKLLSDSMQELVKKIWSNLLKNQGGLHSTNENLTRDGRIIWCEWHNTPLSGDDGVIIGVSSLVQDITERRELEVERVRASRIESIGLLAGGIAHDFNNHLTAIMGNITLARAEAMTSTFINEVLTEAELACQRARELASQLLTFSKGGEPVRRRLDLIKIVKSTASFSTRGSNVTVVYPMDQDIWPVSADEGQINQVINNLVLNAIQAMPQGGEIAIGLKNEEITVSRHTTLPVGRYVKLMIADTGMGIEESNLSKIFDPYFTTKQSGSGLGLATSYSIIRRHGGHMMVKSTVGVGTTFEIYLPANAEGTTEEKESQSAPAVASGGKILIMDDEEIILTMLRRSLSYPRWRVICSRDGEEALRLYKEAMDAGDPFDAVVFDLTIRGGKGGEEAIRELRQMDPNAKAIVMSGFANNPVLANYLQYGFDAMLSKPFRHSDLVATLQHVLRSKKAVR